MNVLITGGMGVNGAVTARLLVKEGLRPVLLDNRMDLSLMRDIKDRVDCVEADICDQQALEKTIDAYKITHIAHLAALMPEPAEANPRLGIKVGVDGTVNILEVARAKGKSNALFSPARKRSTVKSWVSKAPPTFKPVTRRSIPSIRRICMARSRSVVKRSADTIARPTGSSSSRYVLYRSMVRGKKRGTARSLSMASSSKKREKGRSGMIPQGGDQQNDAVYVGDVARSIYLALKAEKPDAWVFNIGTGQGMDAARFSECGGEDVS